MRDARVNGGAMNRRLKYAMTITALSAAGIIEPCLPRLLASPVALQASEQGAQGRKDFEQHALAADRAFMDAAAKSDTAALDKLLDARFTWTDAGGKTLARREFLQQAPKPAIAISDAETQGTGDAGPAGARDFSALIPLETFHNYGSVESIQIHSGKDHALHVWVNRSGGWRLLIYQEVRSLDAPPAPRSVTREACENPCRKVPFEPKNQDERDIVAGFMAINLYAVEHDPAHWTKYVADEFEAANSNSDQTLTKRGRMEGLTNSKMAGYTPAPVVEMHILDFGIAAIIICKHQPEHGQPIHVTRVWTKRAGQWMEAAAYQTRIEGAATP
jgi:hypothetical protein